MVKVKHEKNEIVQIFLIIVLFRTIQCVLLYFITKKIRFIYEPDFQFFMLSYY